MHEVRTPVVAIQPRGERVGKRLEDGKGWCGSQGQLIVELKAMLAEARRPWWRRLIS